MSSALRLLKLIPSFLLPHTGLFSKGVRFALHVYTLMIQGFLDAISSIEEIQAGEIRHCGTSV